MIQNLGRALCSLFLEEASQCLMHSNIHKKTAGKAHIMLDL